VPDLTTPEGRLEAVRSDLELFRAEWERLGRPLFAPGSKVEQVAHPLIKMMRAAELSAERMERRLEATRELAARSERPGKRSRLASLPTSGAVAH
jgi:hypothetical protein